MYSDRTNRAVIQYVRSYKTKNPCADCDKHYFYACMQFDHLDAEKKTATINRLMYRASLETVMKEIEKCELVCANCHAKFHDKLAVK